MISMKNFFLYIVICVYMWNCQIYAVIIKQSEDNNVYGFKIQARGKVLNMNNYKDMVLIIFNESMNMKFNDDHATLMNLAKKYHGNRLRVLAFVYNFKANVKNRRDVPGELINIDKMSESKIEVFNIEDLEANELWKYMSNMESESNEGLMDQVAQSSLQREMSISSNNRIFIVDKNGKVFKRYNNYINAKLLEESILELLEIWKYANSLYELVVFKYKGNSVSMSDYKDNLLIFSSLTLGSKKDIKFQYLDDVAEKYTNRGLKVLVFLCQNDNELENDAIKNEESMNNSISYITFNDINKKYDLFDCNFAKTDLWTYMNMQITEVIYKRNQNYSMESEYAIHRNDILKNDKTFIVGRNGEVITLYDNLNHDFKDLLQHTLEMGKYTKSLYDFDVFKYKDKLVSMSDYKDNVLIILSLSLESEKDNKFQTLLDLAEKYIHNSGLKIIVFLCPNTKKNNNSINKIVLNDICKFHKFECNLAKNELWTYMNMKINHPPDNMEIEHEVNRKEISESNEIFLVDKNEKFIGRYDVLNDYNFIKNLMFHLLKMGAFAKNIYEHVVVKYKGILVPLSNYKCNVLLIFTLRRQQHGFKYDDQLQFLIYLANKYTRDGLRILVFQYLDNSNDKDSINNPEEYKTINYISKIFDLIDDTFAKTELYGYMNMNSSQPSNKEILERNVSFIVESHEKSIKRYDVIEDHMSIQDRVQHLLKTWKYAENFYELVVFEHKGNPVSMRDYKGHVLIISSLTLGSKKNTKYNTLFDIANKYTECGVKILVFLGQNDNENNNVIYKKSMEDKITLNDVRKFNIFENNFARNDLWNFMNMIINQPLDQNRWKIQNAPANELQVHTNFIVNQKGENIQGYKDSSFTNVETILKTYLSIKEKSVLTKEDKLISTSSKSFCSRILKM